MTRYLSNFECELCHESIVWDSDAKTLSCGCGTFKCEFINLNEFRPIPDNRMQKVLTDIPNMEK